MPPELQGQGPLIAWAIQIGGPLFVALLITMYFYRRDFLRAVKEAQTKERAAMDLIVANTAAMNGLRDEVREVRHELRRR